MNKESMRFILNKAFVGFLLAICILSALELMLGLLGLDFRQDLILVKNGYDVEGRTLEVRQSDMDVMAGTILHNVLHNELTYPDQALIYRVKPNLTGELISGYSGINSEGFRGDEFNLTKRSGKRIAFLGNSCAFGWQIKDHTQTISAQLSTKLNQTTQNCEVFNLGQPGYSTTQIVALYQIWAARLNPDVLIIYAGWNDLWETPLLTDAQTIDLLQFRNRSLIKIISQSRLYALVFKSLMLANVVNSPTERRPQVYGGNRPRVPLDESIGNFRKLIDRNPKTIIVLPPFCCYEKFKPLEEFKNKLQDELKGYATFIRIPRMEMDASDASKYFFTDGFHPNEEGAELIAQMLFDLILQEL